MNKNNTKFSVATMALVITLSLLSCSNDIDQLAPEQADILSVNGNCDIYEIDNTESAAWTITSASAWITPFKAEGVSGDIPKIYVESNSSGIREGKITIKYKNGKSRSVTVTQSDDQTTPSIQRTYAAGWSFDVRSYMDFRGLKEQILNTQKLFNFDEDMYCVEPNKSSHIDFYYGESGSELSDDMNAKLNINGKFNSFSLDLQGSFGKSALNNSNRIYSKIRSTYQECVVYLNQFDVLDAQEENLFTADFAAERQRVIDCKGSDESVRNLINRYGTHLVIKASLGGFYDYYFSSVVENSSDLLNVEAALKVGFAEKFKLDADAKYKDDFNKLNKERIEKFAVKGGDAITISMAVEDGTINQNTTDAWLASLRDMNKYELLTFQLIPISELFPGDIKDKINDYTDRLYYREVPVTRSAK